MTIMLNEFDNHSLMLKCQVMFTLVGLVDLLIMMCGGGTGPQGALAELGSPADMDAPCRSSSLWLWDRQ